MSMLEISKIYNNVYTNNPVKSNTVNNTGYSRCEVTKPEDFKKVSADNLRAYIPSFSGIKKAQNTNTMPSEKSQIKAVKAQLDKESLFIFNKLNRAGVLSNNDSNDGSSVLDNLYKIATEPRFKGLSSSQILKDVLKSIDNPYTITQRFGDIPQKVRDEYQTKTGRPFPQKAVNVASSCCVVASMEFNLAQRKPAEFARFAQGLSSEDYKVEKKLKFANTAGGSITTALYNLRKFNTDSQIHSNFEDYDVTIRPDRNAIVRARVQSSYKDAGERSVVDVLIQSALLNLGSQHTYNALTDERSRSEFNDDITGLSNIEKNVVEEIVFEEPKISVVYQQIDENGYLIGYNAEPNEVKQHILNSLNLGQNVIIGYTHLDANNQVNGGHEITILDYVKDKDGKEYFVCNDTDDGIDEPIRVLADDLIPLIHHAGISLEALNENDVMSEPVWVEVANALKTQK